MDKLFSSQRRVSFFTVLAIITVFFAVNILSSAIFRHARIDLTDGNLFTLSDGTVNILKGLEEPVSIKLYYSERVATELPEVRTTAERLKDLLTEFSDTADDKLNFEIIPVERYTESEDEASEAGLTGAQTRDGEIVYFGLIATNAVDGREVVPFVPLDREEYLEYDLISIIYRLDRNELPVLGLITSLPLDTGPGGMAAAMQGRGQPYVIYEQLLGSFEVEHIDSDAAAIPEGVEVLLIAHPDALALQTLYAIDQFVMGGGRVLALLDPFSEMSQTGQPQMTRGGQQPVATNDSSALALGPLLESWGIVIDPDFIVADRALGYYVPQSDYPPILLWPRLTDAEMDRDDIVTAELTLVQFASAGSINLVEDATSRMVPLVTSSPDSALTEIQDAKFKKPFEEILSDFVPDEKSHVMAARIQGMIKSAFPDGRPEGAGADDETEDESGVSPHIIETEAANIIVIADADFVDDRFWVQIQSFLGERLMQPTADNGSLVVGAVENLMGSDDLISLRTRAGSQRPFTLVQKIQREAEEKFLPRQQELEAKLEEIAARVDELRGASTPQDGDDTIIVTDEERAELKALLAEHEETRKAQRMIQFNLRRDIDQLGNRVRFINIAVMPFIVAGFALGLATFQRRRRRKAAARRT